MNDRKIPPQSIESEMSILGSVFCDNSCIKKVSSLIDAMDFYRENHRKIFKAFLSMQIQGLPFDLVTTHNYLKSAGELEEIGGGAYLATLVDYVPTAANVHFYCKSVKEMSVRRQMISLAMRVEEMAYGSEDVGDIIPEVKSGLSEISEGLDSFGGVSLSHLTTFDARLESYKQQVRTIEKTRFITGYHLLDQKIRGVAPGEVLTTIAEPGGFKTAWLQNLLKRGAKRTGRYHLFFSLEMPGEKVFEREIQIDSECSGWEVEQHFTGQQRINIDTNAIKQNGGDGLIVCTKPRLTLEKMARYIELTNQKFGAVNAVGIDYMGLIAGPGKPGYERTAYVAPEIKNMAKELNVPIILLAQINREGAKDQYDIKITDAKGGSDIEASADIMLGFYTDKAGELVCKGLKNRNGPIGWKFQVEINRKAFQFIDLHEYTEQKAKKEDESPY